MENNKKIVLITGSTSGIGLETATQLALKGFQVIVHGRTQEKAENALKQIKEKSLSENIRTIVGDFDSFSEVKKMAETLIKTYSHLDVLINNAAAGFYYREVSKDGHEKTNNTNVFSPFLLTFLLLPLLNKSRKARVICVTSLDHEKGGEITCDNLENEPYSFLDAYHHSKRYIIWIHRHFISYCKENGFFNINFNYCHPGIVNTDLNRDIKKNSFLLKFGLFLMRILMISIDKAAYSSVYLASSEEVEGKDGLYIGPKGPEQVNWTSYNEVNDNKVWDYCMEITKNFR